MHKATAKWLAPPSKWAARSRCAPKSARAWRSLVKGPHFEGGSQIKKLEPDRFYATVGYPIKKAGEVPPQHAYLDSKKIGPLVNLNEDLTLAARSSLTEMIDWLVKTKGYTADQAYVITSVACDLRIGNVVDVPNYAVSTICPLEIFRK